MCQCDLCVYLWETETECAFKWLYWVMLTHLFPFLMSHPYQSSKAGCVRSFMETHKKCDASVCSFPLGKCTIERVITRLNANWTNQVFLYHLFIRWATHWISPLHQSCAHYCLIFHYHIAISYNCNITASPMHVLLAVFEPRETLHPQGCRPNFILTYWCILWYHTSVSWKTVKTPLTATLIIEPTVSLYF